MYFLPILVWIPIVIILVNKLSFSKGYSKVLIFFLSYLLTFLLTYGIYVFTELGTYVTHLSAVGNVFWLLYLFLIAPIIWTVLLTRLSNEVGSVKS
ncbi:hypothetical protein COR50_14210 [Chitinophaga caeni]|uniref:Uncharacterized protein n=1 Tax=Chitinophaga caeni TaxID=2029983 RepID=A0A291QW67_9BACT|nr:hypothetical protein COR50_14115 [Chitinophaga caeni]ATL48224.1 hypothetical protein COR50_14210 [Chitinophaga caeni]